MLWVLIWIALVAAAVVVLGGLIRSVWRRFRALLAEFALAQEQLAGHLEAVRAASPDPADAAVPAVFDDPARWRTKAGMSRSSGHPRRGGTQAPHGT